MHWQFTLGSAAVRETSPLAEPPVTDFLRMPKHSIAKIKIKYNIFFFTSNFWANLSQHPTN